MIKNEGKIMDVFIQAQFDENDLLIRTNYWETEVCQKGYYYLIHYKGNYFLLTPENNDLVSEIAGTQSIVISRGNYKGKNDCFEIMFEDNSDYPYMIILEDEQVYRITNMEEGWTGRFFIYSGSLENYVYHSDKVYYRVTQTIPFLQSVEEDAKNMSKENAIDNNLISLSKEEALEAMKNGERLVNGKERYDIAHYHLYQGRILKSDSYYDLVGEGEVIEEDELPQLYRMSKGIFGSTGTETFDNADEVLKKMVTDLLEKNEYPLSIQMFGLEGLKSLLITIAQDAGRPYTIEKLLASLTMIENSQKKFLS
jgi:predicted RNase H-like HicB family nuclease